MVDLSNPDTITILEGLRLTDQEESFYRENGYIHRPNVLVPNEISELCKAIDDLANGPDKLACGTQIRYEHTSLPGTRQNPDRAWMISDIVLGQPRWMRLVKELRIVAPLIDLLGPDVDFFNSFVRIKPPDNTAHLDWHQDFPHDLHDRPELVTILIYLDETKQGEAATEVAIGSHKRGAIPHDGNLAIDERLIHEPIRALEAQAGDVVFLNTLTAHRVGRNHGQTDRRVLLVVAKSTNCRDVIGAQHALSGLPLARQGVPVVLVH